MLYCTKVGKEIRKKLLFTLSLAIKFAARGKGTNNLMAKSLFIKIKAMERLGEFVEVLPFAVLCKHLRPKCEKTLRTLTLVKEKINKMIREDEQVANQILIRMVACGKEEMERGQFELALDHFSELLELLYFKIVPGVLLMKAECLLKLVRVCFPCKFTKYHNKGVVAAQREQTSHG